MIRNFKADVLKIAKIAHDTNNRYISHLIELAAAVLKIAKIAPWCIQKDWYVEIIKNLVCYMLEHPRKDLIYYHDYWMLQMEKAGFSYGEEIDLERKFHPSLRPWADLPTHLDNHVLYMVIQALIAAQTPKHPEVK